ncbi:hypothetical protein [Streptomyces zagrosensis]|uniref:Uncharacterized protein n=1 Tax=Streptomyces zagrosensis TaxID=1042984 RepID=A0A7W9QHE6_9ACTN|nr:hypothetical protein [Streptomyces zagrosensis]MBB5939267.1 hypothetical protein [Streptomyces zagrosensis]
MQFDKAAMAALLAMILIPATLTTATAADAQPATTAAMPRVTIGIQTADAQKVRDFWTPARIKRVHA